MKNLFKRILVITLTIIMISLNITEGYERKDNKVYAVDNTTLGTIRYSSYDYQDDDGYSCWADSYYISIGDFSFSIRQGYDGNSYTVNAFTYNGVNYPKKSRSYVDSSVFNPIWREVYKLGGNRQHTTYNMPCGSQKYTSSWPNYSTCSEDVNIYAYDVTFPSVLQYGLANALELIYGTSFSFSNTISFNSNGGSGTMADAIISSSGGTLPSCTFTRTGYSFAGWSTSPTGSVMYGNSANYVPTADATLYAVWNVNKYNVNVSGTGTGGSSTASNVSYGSSVTVNAGTRTGYSFAGWTVSGVSGVNTASSSLTFTMPDNTVSLSANWTANSYNVLVNNTGISGTTGITGSYGDIITIHAGTKTGYSFKDWTFPDSSKMAVLENNSSSTTAFTMPNNAVTIQANWTANEYNVTLANLGEDGSGTGTYIYENTVYINAGTRDGYYFSGWKVEEGSASVSIASSTSSSTIFAMPAGNVVLTAEWIAIRGITIETNSFFDERYKISGYYRSDLDAFDVSKGIQVGKEDVTVYIQTDSGNIEVSNYNFSNHAIRLVGINNIKVVLQSGTLTFEAVLPLTGYSPALTETMEKFSLAETDYEGLANKVSELLGEIERLQIELNHYESTMQAIKDKLSDVDITVELQVELENSLKSVENAIDSAVERIQNLEDELGSAYLWASQVADALGLTTIVEDYESFLLIKDNVLLKINELKSKQNILLDEYNKLLEALGLENRITEGDLENEVALNEILVKVLEIKNDLDLYEQSANNLKALLLIENDGSIESQLDEIYEKVEELLASLTNLEKEIQRILASLGSDIDTSDLSVIESIILQIQTLIDRAEGQERFINSLKILVGIEITATNEELYSKIVELLEEMTTLNADMDNIRDILNAEPDANVVEVVSGAAIHIKDLEEKIAYVESQISVILEKESDYKGIDEVLELVNELKRMLEAYKLDIINLEDIISSKDDKIKELANSSTNDSPNTDESDYLKGIIEQIEKDSDAKDDLIDSLNDLINDLNNQIKDLENASENKDTYISELENRISDLEKDNESANNYIEELEEKQKNLIYYSGNTIPEEYHDDALSLDYQELQFLDYDALALQDENIWLLNENEYLRLQQETLMGIINEKNEYIRTFSDENSILKESGDDGIIKASSIIGSIAALALLIVAGTVTIYVKERRKYRRE